MILYASVIFSQTSAMGADGVTSHFSDVIEGWSRHWSRMLCSGRKLSTNDSGWAGLWLIVRWVTWWHGEQSSAGRVQLEELIITRDMGILILLQWQIGAYGRGNKLLVIRTVKLIYSLKHIIFLWKKGF